MQKVFEFLDNLVKGFMQIIFEGFNNFWNQLYGHGGQGVDYRGKGGDGGDVDGGQLFKELVAKLLAL